MKDNAIGVAIRGTDTENTLRNICRAEELGIDVAWLTTGGVGLDSLTIFAVAAERTSRIGMGTSIVPTYPRHPFVMAQQVQVIAALAPMRFRLGIGPSHRPIMEGMGISFSSPLANLREYIQVLKPLLQEGKVDFDGDQYQAHAAIPNPVQVPVMGSALQKGSFDLCGEIADGAISWICPPEYLRDVALPAMRAGASRVGRSVPPLIAHAPVCVHDNPQEVRQAVREQIMNPRLPFYQRMLAIAGFPEASEGQWSDSMIDAVVFSGDEDVVADRMSEVLKFGASEILASPVLAGGNKDKSLERTMTLLGQAAQGITTS